MGDLDASVIPEVILVGVCSGLVFRRLAMLSANLILLALRRPRGDR